ncbi:RNA polymerase sigma factor [Spongiimicrobium sp. 3-5]|uniref:RNA polymerase sigma factor n=1 Tax=Spongiimicrobium sp. 3-5 TaxID=3332596 RepID=UPI0039813FC9
METDGTFHELTDEQLVQKIVEMNDTLLFGQLYDRYVKIIYNKCYSFSKSKDEAEDLTQDVFLKLFLKLNTFKGRSKFATWFYSFTYNFCVNYVSKKKVVKTDGGIYEGCLDSVGEPEYLPLQESEEELMQIKSTKLKNALELIDPEDKSILLLKYQDDVTVKELETLLGITEGAVKMRLRRARSKVLRAYYKLV